MANKTIKGLTVEIGGDTTKLGKALQSVEDKSNGLSKELRDINKLLKLDPGNTALLAQKQKVLAEAVETTGEKLKKLKEAEKQVQKQFEKGDVSEEQVRALQREIVATTKKMDRYEQEAEETKRALRSMGDETEKVEKSSGELGSKLASVAKTGLAAVAAACAAAVAGLTAAAESTREYRTEMGKLDTAFTTSGHTSKAATETYKTMVGILGETDQAVEASNHLAKLCKNEEELATWTDIATGVYATFGDSLPVENITEAANETAKTGSIVGGLADALNWAGVSEEEFQAKLDACSSEQERANLITEILNGLYSETAEKYRETNAEVIRANEANDNWMQSLAGVGAVIEPIITDIKNMGAALLTDLLPGITQMAEAFRGLLSGDAAAAGGIGTALSGMVTGLLEKVSNLLPTLLQVGGSIISNLVTGIVTNLPKMAEKALDAVSSFVNGFQTYLPIVLNKGAELLGKLGEGIRTGLPNLVSRALDIIMRFAETLYNNAPKLIATGFDLLKNLVQGIVNSLPALLSKAPEIISKFANIINDNFPTILKKGVELIWELIKGIIKAIPTLIANIPKIITAIVDVWEAFNWLNLGKKAIDLLGKGIKSMFGFIKTAGKGIMDACTNVLKNLPQNLLNLGKSAINGLGTALRNGWGTVKSGAMAIFNGIVNYFKGLPKKMLSVGKDLVKGLWNGISNMTGWVIGKIQGFGDKVLGGIKDFFGIESPSTVMRDEVGAMLDAGLAEGITDNAKQPVRAMQRMTGGIMDAASGGIGFERSLTTPKVSAAPYTTGALGLDTLAAKLDGIYERLGRLQIVLDTGTLVGETLDKIDAGLATNQLLRARGV